MGTLTQANQNLGDQSGPAGLVAGATGAAGVAMKIFMKGNQIAPVGIIVEEFAIAEHCSSAFRIKQEDTS